MQARDDSTPQMNIESIHYYNIGAPDHFDKVSNTEMMGLIPLRRMGVLNQPTA